MRVTPEFLGRAGGWLRYGTGGLPFLREGQFLWGSTGSPIKMQCLGKKFNLKLLYVFIFSG